VLGLALVYRAFEIGTLSLVSPISAGFAVVTAILAMASGEKPPFLALAGALLLCFGVVLATRGADHGPGIRGKIRGVPEALGSALAFGTMFWLFYFYVQPTSGYIWPLIILKTMASGASAFAVAHARRRRGRGGESPIGKPGRIWLLAAGAAAADTLAWLAYIWGTASSYATIVTALASLFSVVTILLAWMLLRERLGRGQWAGVAIILLGILLVSL